MDEVGRAVDGVDDPEPVRAGVEQTRDRGAARLPPALLVIGILPSSPLSRLMLNFLHSKCCRCFAKGLMIKMESAFLPFKMQLSMGSAN